MTIFCNFFLNWQQNPCLSLEYYLMMTQPRFGDSQVKGTAVNSLAAAADLSTKYRGQL